MYIGYHIGRSGKVESSIPGRAGDLRKALKEAVVSEWLILVEQSAFFVALVLFLVLDVSTNHRFVEPECAHTVTA